MGAELCVYESCEVLPCRAQCRVFVQAGTVGTDRVLNPEL